RFSTLTSLAVNWNGLVIGYPGYLLALNDSVWSCCCASVSLVAQGCSPAPAPQLSGQPDRSALTPCRTAYPRMPQTPGTSPACPQQSPTLHQCHALPRSPGLPGRSSWNRTSAHTWSRSGPPWQTPSAMSRRDRPARCPDPAPG